MSSPVDHQGPSNHVKPARSRWLCWFVPGIPGPLGNVTFLVGCLPMALLLSLILASRSHRHARNLVKNAPADKPLPALFALPDFSLTERSGDTVTRATLAGKVWIADFIFTTCPGPCPRMTRRMAGLQTALADLPDLRLVTITVDPKRDTPERLKEYAAKYGAEPQRWLFLTGDREAIYRLSTDGFKLAAIVEQDEVQSTDHPILHSTRFVLVDREGQVRAYYDGTSEKDMERLAADARRLAAE